MKYFVHKDVIKNEDLLNKIVNYIHNKKLPAPCIVNTLFDPFVMRFDIDEELSVLIWDIDDYIEITMLSSSLIN